MSINGVLCFLAIFDLPTYPPLSHNVPFLELFLELPTYPKIGCHLWMFPKHFLLTSYKSVLAISTSGQQAIKCNFNTNLKQASIVECVPICMTLPCHPLALVSDGSMQEINCQSLCPTTSHLYELPIPRGQENLLRSCHVCELILKERYVILILNGLQL